MGMVQHVGISKLFDAQKGRVGKYFRTTAVDSVFLLLSQPHFDDYSYALACESKQQKKIQKGRAIIS